MRRLAALAITIGLAWLVVARLGDATAGSAALALGVALLSAAIVGWLFQFLHLPRITGYLVFGVVCGPSVFNIITQPMARDLQAANGFAIAIIAFVAGLQLNLRRFGPRLRTITTMGAATIAVGWMGLAGALYLLWPFLPFGETLAGLERAAAVALAATMLLAASPTVTIAVIAENRARGALADLSAMVVVLIELVVILMFAFGFESARLAFGSPVPDAVTIGIAIAGTVVASLVLGAALGAVFVVYLDRVGREVTLVLLGLCALIAAAGTRVQFDPLLVGLAAGFVVQNVRSQTGDALRVALQRGGRPVLLIFFVTIGASMPIDALAALGAFALGLSLLRVVLLRAGVWLGARAAGVDTPEIRRLWTALVSMAGVTLGFAVMVAAEFPDWGVPLQTFIVAVVALHEVVGPVLFRKALADLKEVGGIGGSLVVVSNREPWMHEYAPDGSVEARPTPGGVAVALDALMRERGGGVWIAHGAGDADRAVVDDRDSVEVPPDAPVYRLRRLWMTSDEEEHYLAGFANSTLWPLCHQAHVRPAFHPADWQAYQAVNRRFADIVAIEAPPDSSVFLNDYHLALVAGYLRARRPTLRTALFWHIPWPDIDRLRICPWRHEMIEGLLANDLIAFQLDHDRQHFLHAVSEEIGASVSGDTVYFDDRSIRVFAVPIGADYDRISSILADKRLPSLMARYVEELGLGDRVVGVGVDRLDYTKGIPERIEAIEHLLEARPELVDRFAFVQIAVPSRPDVPGYAEISAEIDDHVARVNERFGHGPTDGPIRYVKKTWSLPQLVALYRLADFCVVSSLHDGMNLVAKEFVAARDDEDGVLILSELAGAAQELEEALIINPYDEQGFASAIARALDMSRWERHHRMQLLRRRVAGRDVLAWASDILDRLEQQGVSFRAG